MRRFALAAVVAASMLLVTGPPATAASFVMQNTPNPLNASQSHLGGVSCSAATSCIAVGSFTDNSGQHLLAEARSGSTWTIQTTSDPAGATGSHLRGVSCTSGSSCTAVGDYLNGASTMLTLAEAWNGAGWSVQSTPNPAGSTANLLNRVSCTSSTACIAVGWFTDGGGATVLLAEAWNGTIWAIKSVPIPAGATNSELGGVSCTSAVACTAVGSFMDGTGHTLSLAEAWNGSTWSIQSTPNPTGATYSPLKAVSCPSATACMAVGVGLAESWNGTTWTLQTLASPHGTTPANLSGVSCASATACMAAGGFYNSGAIQTLVSESWNGTMWRLQNTPITTSNDSSLLYDVSCQAAAACTAVGSFHNSINGDRTLAEDFALRWQLQSPAVPSGAIASNISGVSCASAKACMAVGDFESSGSTFSAFVENYNGTTWTELSTPNATSSSLGAVSCTSPTACTAVGSVLIGGSNVGTLAERWDGISWTAQSTPNPAGATRSFLTGVSCFSATGCTAVGSYYNSGGKQLTLAEAWDGTSWTIKHTPNPTGTTTSQLNGVSCKSATACVAVGAFVSTSYRMLAEGWNGTTWAIQSITNPGGGTTGYLNGVSCKSATACTAVGSYVSGTQSVVVAERWNGTSWKPQTPVIPSGVQSSSLTSVSCASATACSAVGEVRNGAGTWVTLAERWDGTSWAVQDTGNLDAGPQGSHLKTLSCPSATNCMAAGWLVDSTATEIVLAGRYA